ncbi:MAG: hypothetical protein ABIO93_08615 [Dyadobacter sp.]|uniref:hypothetical protein n=1 Tax=Dyadobacter sp. TaxID=1914288 RepID=UPI0032645D27
MAQRLLASLILLNYLWMAAMGCISRPEQVPYMLMVEKSFSDHNRYEERRYMRMDGLEVLMAEVMSTRYTNSAQDGGHLDISVSNAIDCHFAPEYLLTNFSPILVHFRNDYIHFDEIPVLGIPFAIFSPPKHPATI